MLLIGKWQVKALSALKHLQGLFEEGPESFTERVMQEIASPKMASKDNHVEGRASSPLLREVQETAELLRAEVINAEPQKKERPCGRDCICLSLHKRKTLFSRFSAAAGSPTSFERALLKTALDEADNLTIEPINLIFSTFISRAHRPTLIPQTLCL